MKLSKYNLTVPYKDKYILYNMLTKAIVLVDNLDEIKASNEVLCRQGFFVNECIDELSMAEKKFHLEQKEEKHLLLTIIPTLQCNLDCTYCYQHDMHYTNETIGNDVLNGILEEIKKDNRLESVHVDWNGGEPTLELDKIKQFSKMAISICETKDIEYTATISTNLFMVDQEKINILKSANVIGIDTTLIGLDEVHDKYRVVRGEEKKGSFKSVWENILLVSKEIPVAICINMIRDSEANAQKLLELIAAEKNDKLSVTFLWIEDYGYGEKSMFLTKEEHFPIMLRLQNYALKLGIKAEINSNFGNKFVFCSAQLDKAFIIHPSGRIYKCSNNYNIDNSLGIVGEKGFEIFKNRKSIDPYADSKCRNCDLVAYCNGGCTFARENNKDFCPKEREYIDDVLRLYVSSKFEL